MPYKNDVEPKLEDSVIGIIDGSPASGKVKAISKDGKKITVERRGPSLTDERSRQKTQGQIEQHQVPVEDFELIYRKES